MQTIKLDDLERQLVARKRELGIAGINFLPVNDGARRTASKRQLLRVSANFDDPLPDDVLADFAGR